MAWGDKVVSFDQRGDGFQTVGSLTREEMWPGEKFVFDALEDNEDIVEIKVTYRDGIYRTFKRGRS